MYKRHFIFALVCLLSFAAGSQNLSAQSQIAQDTYAIFQGSCLICHGPDGAYRESLLMEHTALIDGGTVAPGNPDASELYKRLLGPTENGAQMPFGQPQLPPQSIETIRQWILAGAPDWKTAPATDRPFISPAEKLNTIETHLMSLEPFDRAYARYFTLTHLYNAGETAEILQEYRKALYKLVNSLSWGATIINPIPIDAGQTIFYIDLRHYEWDANDGWTTIEEEYPYHIPFDAPEQTTRRTQTRTVADPDEVRYTFGAYRLVYCHGVAPAALPRPAFFAVNRKRIGDAVGGGCGAQSDECARGSRLASGIQQFGSVQ